MGLSADIKAFLKESYETSFIRDEDCAENVKLLIIDWMWLLYHFVAKVDASSTGLDLIDYAWEQVACFREYGGQVCVLCFDCPEHVPNAKSATQAKRRQKSGGCDGEPEAIDPRISDDCLPRPYALALTRNAIRNDVLEYMIQGLHKRAAERISASDDFCLVTQWRNVQQSPAPGRSSRAIHVPNSVEIGEADIGVVFWLKQYETLPAVIRVQDSDMLCITLLNLTNMAADVPRYIWLVSKSGCNNASPREVHTLDLIESPGAKRQRLGPSISSIGEETHELIDVNRLAADIETEYSSVDLFCFLVILQKTDFVEKVLIFANVTNTLRQAQFYLSKQQKMIIVGTGSQWELDVAVLENMLQCMQLQMSGSGASPIPLKYGKQNRRVRLHASWVTEVRRAWWNWMYWKTAACGKLQPDLAPSRVLEDGKSVHGWTPAGESVDVRASLSEHAHTLILPGPNLDGPL